MSTPLICLEDITILSDNGTWGDESNPNAGMPVLRSTNIQENKVVLDEVAWRDLSKKHRESKVMQTGDLLVTTSSGSPQLIGKCCIFQQPENGLRYYFSNFTMRLRIDATKMEPKWLYYWLISERGRNVLASMNSTTSGLRNLNKNLYLKQKIPCPELQEQRRIIAILDKADEIKSTSLQIQDSRIRIIQSVFVEMFGDPIINPNNYPKILFGELGTLDRGKSKHRPRNDPRLLGGTHPLIQTGEIRLADLFVNTFNSTYSDFGLAQSRKWPAGTLAITIAANIAESAILGIEACFPDSIVGFTPNSNSNSVFIKAQLDFLKDRISEVAPQSAQKNINLKILREIPMICPPIEIQEQFEDFVRNATQIFDSANKGIDMAEELAKSSVQSLIN